MHLKTIFKSLKNKDMLKRIMIVMGLLVAYRLLAHVPVPLGDPTTFKDAIEKLISNSDFGGFLNLISGGGLTSFSIILVGISPYITASIVIQLIVKAIPSLEEMSQDGEAGRKKINQWTRMISVPLAVIQSVAYMFILYNSVIASNSAAPTSPTLFTWILSATTMTAGSVILMWIGELITEQGIGNGISLIIFTSILSQVLSNITKLGLALFNTSGGTLSLFGWINLPVNPTIFFITLALGLLILGVIYLLVKINEAQRVIVINYAKRVHGNRSYGGIKSIMPIKLIAAGVIPVIFATSFLSLPAMIGQFVLSSNPSNEFAKSLVNFFTAPSSNNFAQQYPNGITSTWFIYPIMYFALVVMFTYFYTTIIFNTKEIADNLQKQGGFIESIRPGAQTAKYFDGVLNRLNLFGAFSLGLIALLPFIVDYISIIIFKQPIGLSLSGTGLLIVITVALENLRQLDSRALMVTYDSYK